MKRLLIFIFLILSSKLVLATVDVLYVNHTTKQLYWGDESAGFIGWDSTPDGIYEETEARCLADGYTFTSFPYLIEVSLLILLFCIIISIRSYKRRKATN